MLKYHFIHLFKNEKLNFRTDGTSGTITVNGYERNLSHFRKQSCYIMQDNALHENLRISEAMRFAANLKLDKGCKKKQQIV